MRIVWTPQFKKDYRRAKKRGRPLNELKEIAEALAEAEALDAKYKDHSLKGYSAKTYRECHIKLDWLLIYRIDEDAVVFIRTGTHSDLFK